MSKNKGTSSLRLTLIELLLVEKWLLCSTVIIDELLLMLDSTVDAYLNQSLFNFRISDLSLLALNAGNDQDKGASSLRLTLIELLLVEKHLLCNTVIIYELLLMLDSYSGCLL